MNENASHLTNTSLHGHKLNTTQRQRMLRVLLFGQFLLVMVALSFAGGGGIKGHEPTLFIYFKGLFLLLPITSLLVLAVYVRPISVTALVRIFITPNLMLSLLVAYAYVMLIFAYDPIYSMRRLTFMTGSLIAWICLWAQYTILYKEYVIAAMQRHLLYLFVIYILFNFFMLFYSGQVFPASSALRSVLGIAVPIHPNMMAALTAMGLLHAAFYFRSSRYAFRPKGSYVFQVFILLMSPVVLYMLLSRSVLAALIVSFVLASLVILLWRSHTQSLRVLSFVLFLACSITFAVASGLIESRAISSLILRGDSVERFYTLNHRTVIWAVITNNMTILDWLTGNGFSVIIEGFGIDLGTGTAYGAHNVYVSILASLGVFGLLFYVMYLLALLGRLFQNSALYDTKKLQYFLTLILFLVIDSFANNHFSLNLTPSFALFFIQTTLEINSKNVFHLARDL